MRAKRSGPRRYVPLKIRLSALFMLSFMGSVFVAEIFGTYGVPLLSRTDGEGGRANRNMEALSVAAFQARNCFDSWFSSVERSLEFVAKRYAASQDADGAISDLRALLPGVLVRVTLYDRNLKPCRDAFLGSGDRVPVEKSVRIEGTGSPDTPSPDPGSYPRFVHGTTAALMSQAPSLFGTVGVRVEIDARDALKDSLALEAGTLLPGLVCDALEADGTKLVETGGKGYANPLARDPAVFDADEMAAVVAARGPIEAKTMAGASVFAWSAGAGARGLDLYFVARIAPGDIIVESVRNRASSLVFDLLAALAGMSTIFVVASRSFRAIEQLDAAAAEIEAGSFDVVLPRNADGELGNLTRSFERMIGKMRAWYAELELAVRERTAELGLRNRAMEYFSRYPWDVALREVSSLLAEKSGCDRVTVARVAVAHVQADGPAPDAPTGGETESAGESGEIVWIRGVKGVTGFIRYRGVGAGAADVMRQMAEYLAPLFDAHEKAMAEENVRRRAEEAVRRSERRFRTLFEQAPDIMVTTDGEGVVTGMNRYGEAQFGEDWKTRPVRFAEWILDDYNRNYYAACLKEHRAVRDLEAPLRTAWSEPIEALLTARVIDEGGQGSVMIFVKDVTERVNAERALWKTNEVLGATNKELREAQLTLVNQAKLASIGLLSAGIAHEINNPLGFLKSNSESMNRYARALASFAGEALKTSDERDLPRLRALWNDLDLDYMVGDIGSLAAESQEGFRRINEIISSLRTFARTDSSPALVAYDVNKGLESSISVGMNEIKYVADLERDYGELPPVPARGGEMNQVFLNLLVNAAHAIGERHADGSGKGLIRVSTRLEGAMVAIRVSDDGGGMSAETVQKVFDPFFTTKEPGHGTGLGLSISWDIVVNKHHGEIGVVSKPGSGSEFTVRLPVRRPEPEHPPGEVPSGA